MTAVYNNVQLASLDENGKVSNEAQGPVKIQTSLEGSKAQIVILNGNNQTLKQIAITKDVESARVGSTAVVLSSGSKSLLVRFPNEDDAKVFSDKLQDVVRAKQFSVFTQRTDAASAEQYFQFYGYLSQQQNMMQDYIRTSTYQRAMLDNGTDFEDKVVLDVGAGSGILSFFAIQAGARKVYAIEASSMAKHCEALVASNKLLGRIEVIPGKVEEVELPEQVDLIISEPMGYMLFNERMLESYLHAKKWLKPRGKMFPSQGDLHMAPFTDESLYMEQFSKANFWYQQAFHGVDLSSLRQAAIMEYFKQPIVDTFDIRICMSRSQKYVVDFQTAGEEDLHNIDIPVMFNILQSGTVHGLAFWFDVAFIGSQSTVWLSTSPTQPLTHWYQVRCLLQNPIFVKQGQTLSGKVVLRANKRQSYDVDIELIVPGTNTKSCNTLDLKNPFFRYTGQAPSPPPGTNHTSPTDSYWNQTEGTATVDGTGFTLLNGASLNDGQNQAAQQGVAHNNLVPLVVYQQQQASAANVAPINPGSIPAATIVNAVSQALQTRTSVGAGITPALLQTSAATTASHYPVSNQFMIGDYVIPGNMVLPTQGLNIASYKTGGNV